LQLGQRASKGLGSTRKLPDCRIRNGLFANCDATARSRRAPERRRPAGPVFRQAARVHSRQTADSQQVGTGSYTAALTFPTARSPTRLGRFPFAGPALEFVAVPCVAVRLLEFTGNAAGHAERGARYPRTPSMGRPNAPQRPLNHGDRLAAVNFRELEFLSESRRGVPDPPFAKATVCSRGVSLKRGITSRRPARSSPIVGRAWVAAAVECLKSLQEEAQHD